MFDASLRLHPRIVPPHTAPRLPATIVHAIGSLQAPTLHISHSYQVLEASEGSA
jgi:hypothetical protein